MSQKRGVPLEAALETMVFNLKADGPQHEGMGLDDWQSRL